MTTTLKHDLNEEITHLKDEFNAAKIAFVLVTVSQDLHGEIYSNIASGKQAKEMLADAATNIPDDVSDFVVREEDLEDDVNDSQFVPC